MTRSEEDTVRVGQAKGRPMLSWVGKRPLREVRSFPAQLVSRFAPEAPAGALSDSVDWSEWPARFDRGGLLFHGDNKEVLAHLLANGFRGKVDLVYIDRPFDLGADYVRKVQLRGASGSARASASRISVTRPETWIRRQIGGSTARRAIRSWMTEVADPATRLGTSPSQGKDTTAKRPAARRDHPAGRDSDILARPIWRPARS